MQQVDIHSQEIQDKVSALKILAHPIRYSIALILYQNGVMNVGAIQEALDLAQSTVSQHISKMREAGIVSARRDGTKIFYELSNEIAKKTIANLEK